MEQVHNVGPRFYIGKYKLVLALVNIDGMAIVFSSLEVGGWPFAHIHTYMYVGLHVHATVYTPLFSGYKILSYRKVGMEIGEVSRHGICG